MIVTRFAPSPTGYLHLGHAFAALVGHDTAQAAAGRFLLRMENIDMGRCRPEFEDAIHDDLKWLGLEWAVPVLRQSERFDAYRAALARFEAQGLTYPCFCTRSEIAAELKRALEAPHGPDGLHYPGICRSLAADERRTRLASGAPYAVRLDASRAAAKAGLLLFEERGSGPDGERGSIAVNPALSGDIVLARKDVPASYHLAVVVDDAFQGVTLVTRGHDLFAATHVQRLLQRLLGLPAPVYAHHRLVLDEHGRKFSKRDGARTVRSLRESGVTREQIRARLRLPSGRV